MPLCLAGICALIGLATVTDGDTLRIRGQAVRLQGIDAPELSESLGPEAREALRSLVSGLQVKCWPDGSKTHKRVVAVCFIHPGLDLGAEMVRRGLALDCARYSGGRYRSLEPSSARLKITQKPYC